MRASKNKQQTERGGRREHQNRTEGKEHRKEKKANRTYKRDGITGAFIQENWMDLWGTTYQAEAKGMRNTGRKTKKKGMRE